MILISILISEHEGTIPISDSGLSQNIDTIESFSHVKFEKQKQKAKREHVNPAVLFCAKAGQMTMLPNQKLSTKKLVISTPTTKSVTTRATLVIVSKARANPLRHAVSIKLIRFVSIIRAINANTGSVGKDAHLGIQKDVPS